VAVGSGRKSKKADGRWLAADGRFAAEIISLCYTREEIFRGGLLSRLIEGIKEGLNIRAILNQAT
jgi:hypothetical protein